MDSPLVIPFVNSTRNVFATMVGCELSPAVVESPDSLPFEVSGLVGFGGGVAGMIVVRMCRDMALTATEMLLGQRPTELDADVLDTVGELANMIAGSAKRELRPENLSISLPSVIVGGDHRVRFGAHATPTVVCFESEHGVIRLDVALAEVAAPV